MNYKDAVIKYFSDHQDDYDSDMHEVSKISDTTAIKLHKLICKGCNNETEIDTETDEELWWFYHYYETKGESQLEYLKQLADRGDVLAMFEIGRDLECSSFDEVKSDMIKYFSMAAEKGHVESMYKLGKHYYHEKDLSKAKKYLEMAISKGHAKAHCAIAICYVDEVIANSNDSDSDFEIPETTMDKNVSADEMDKALKIAKTHLLVGVAVDDVESMMLLGQLYLCFKPMDLAMGEKYSTMAYEKSLEKKDYTCYGQQALFNLGHYF